MPKKSSSKKPDTDPDIAKTAAKSGSGQGAGAAHSASDKNSELEGESNGESESNQVNEEELDRTTFSSVAGCPPSPETDSKGEADSEIGRLLLGKYQISELRGSGGMSRVYKAQQLLTKKVVALKLLHKHLSSNPVMMRRFQAEAQASHHLAHPHIITVYDFGITDENQPFIVMDYLEGRALSEIIKTWGQLSIERCLTIVDQILDALEHAHESGVLHRDLKPSNIVLIPVGDNTDYVKLVDFGIAKILPKAGLEAQELTQSGDVFGSPLYMSPEQCLGNMTDARSDIYSVGCLLYECLAGKPPLIGNNTLETMHKQVSEMPASLSTVNADVRLVKQLEDIVFKAMAKEPENRFQSALEMRKAISQTQSEWREGSAILAYMRRSGAKFERTCQNKLGKRWRSKVIVSGLMTAITLHYVIMMSILYRPGSAPPLAERAITWAAANQPLYKLVAAEKMKGFKPVTDASDTDELAEFASEWSDVSASQSGRFRAYVLRGTNRLYKGDFDSAYRNFSLGLQTAESIGMSDSIDSGYLHMAAATSLVEINEMKGRKDTILLNEAIKHIRIAALIFMSTGQSRPASISKTIEGAISNQLGKHVEAILCFKHAAGELTKVIEQKLDEQRKRDKIRLDAPINFRWGDINPTSTGFQLATMGSFLLSNREGLNSLTEPLPVEKLPKDDSTVLGLPSRSKIQDLAFSRGRLVPRCTFYEKHILTYTFDAENSYQLLTGMCENQGAGKGALPTAVARANLGMASLEKGLALRDMAIDKLRSRNFAEWISLFDQAQDRFRNASKELRLAHKALELHLGSNHKYSAYTLLNLSDAEMNLGHINEAVAARSEAHSILGTTDN